MHPSFSPMPSRMRSALTSIPLLSARRIARLAVVCLLPASAAAAPAASPAPQAPTPRITLQVIDRTGRALEPDRLGAVQDRRGRALSISRLDLMLSGLQLQTGDGRWVGPAGWHGHFRAALPDRHEPLPGLAPGRYRALRFAIGVAPEANHADPNRLAPGDPLHPLVNDMHWGWTGGYVFAAIEGLWQFDRASAGRTGGFSYHLAGDINRIAVTLPGPLQLAAGGTLRLKLDAGRLLAAVDISKDGDSTHSRGDDPPSRALRAALARAFRVEALAPQAAADPRSNATASGAAPIGTTPYRWSVGAHLPRVTLPADNPLTVQGVALGRQLFGDPRLSRDGRISCATCHVPDRAFVDPGRATSRGIDGREGQRNTPALSNLAWSRHFGWDGGRSTLREQALRPIELMHEMGDRLPQVVERLGRDAALQARFRQAFGGPVSAPRLGLALEQYLLTLVAQDAKFDRVMQGRAQFSPAEKRGFELFLTEHDPRQGLRGADCFHCHGGSLFTSQQFASIGLPRLKGRPDDPGRAGVTGLESDRGRFRVPSLRNVELTAPYMHDGRLRTLEEVIDHYDHGVERTPNLDPNLAKHPPAGMGLSAEDKAALVAFLKTLTEVSATRR